MKTDEMTSENSEHREYVPIDDGPQNDQIITEENETDEKFFPDNNKKTKTDKPSPFTFVI